MKKHALTLVAMLSLLLAAGSAFGQMIYVKGNIPFNFIVNKDTLPAGQYDIESFGTMDGRTLLIHDSTMHTKTLVIARSVESRNPSEQTKLVFNRRGNQYFLSQIWIAGEKLGHQLPKSARESEVAKDYNAQQVVVLAQLR
jgi:hypothetical protein